jgi:hypothetical protein
MSPNVITIKNFTIELHEKRILGLIGYRKKSLEGSLKKIISEEKGKLDNIVHPASIYTILEHNETNRHPIFKNALKVALCICTIGPELEKECKDLTKENELLRALILDAYGSETVEEVASQSDKMIAEEAMKMNLWPSKRFSPGYRGWELEEQKFIFQTLPAKEIGVILNESCMMVPRKSISFRINFYTDKKFTTRVMR